MNLGLKIAFSNLFKTVKSNLKMLAEVIKAMIAEERIMLKRANGELTIDKCGILRNEDGTYAEENTIHHLSLAQYTNHPYLFNLIEMLSFPLMPLRTITINRYLNFKHSGIKQTLQE